MAKGVTVYLPIVQLDGMDGFIYEGPRNYASWKGVGTHAAYMMCEPSGLEALDKWMQVVNEKGWNTDLD